MKKKYSSKLGWLGATLCAFLLVACGLKISKVELSANEIEANGEVTVTTTFTNPDDDTNSGWGDNNGNYLLYAVRVPADWAAADVLTAVSNVDGEYEFEESKAYATLAEYCFPKEGYKWIAFQTTKPCDVNIKNQAGDEVISTLTLKAGEQGGDYKLDVISGAVEADPAELLNADGTLDLTKAFGMKRNLTDVNGHKKLDGENVYALSLYLVCTTTFSADELAAYGKLHLSDTVTHFDKEDDGFGNTTFEGDMTLPVCATADIQNNLSTEELAAIDLNVKVNAFPELSEVIVNGVEIDENVIKVEDKDEVLFFQVPKGYELYYKLFTSGENVQTRANAEDDALEGYAKYDEDGIKLSEDATALSTYFRNTATGNHSEPVTYKIETITTGVNDINFLGTDNAPIFNLNGVRVFDAKAPGIYIKNGKKFIVK